ncbi:MAG: hypothetical protein ACI4OW_07440 [Alphaproteobacteria bacterium]
MNYIFIKKVLFLIKIVHQQILCVGIWVVFSVATIATMILAVTAGLLGLKFLHFDKAEKYAHELAGATIMACGFAIVFGL